MLSYDDEAVATAPSEDEAVQRNADAIREGLAELFAQEPVWVTGVWVTAVAFQPTGP